MIAEEGSLDGSDTDTIKSSPMSQRDFYHHVSGAGEGHALQTTASPPLKQVVTSPLTSIASYGFELEEPEIVSNDSAVEEWSEKMDFFNQQIMSVLGLVEKDKVEISIGKTVIHRDRAVVLAWNKSQQQQNIFEDPNSEDGADGLLLYLSVRFKKEFQLEAEESIREMLRKTELQDDENNNAGKRSSPDGKNSEPSDEHRVGNHSDNDDNDNEDGLNHSRIGAKHSGSRGHRNGRGVNGGKLSGSRNSDQLDYGSDDGSEYEEFEEEIVGEDGVVQRVTVRRKIRESRSGRRSRSLDGDEDDQNRTSDGHRLEHGPNGEILNGDQDYEGDGGRFGEERSRRDRIRRRWQNTKRGLTRSQSPDERSRHENCFIEFEGYDDDYEGPKGILSSRLPDGTSTLDYDPLYVPKEEDLDQSRKNFSRSEASRIRETANNLLEASRFQKRLPECSHHKTSAPSTPGGHRLLTSRVPQVPNRIRRLRSRHVEFDKNTWFVGSVHRSFNSRCSSRFDISDLDSNARQYYYFKSLPRIANQEATPSEISLSDPRESPRRRRKHDPALEGLLL